MNILVDPYVVSLTGFPVTVQGRGRDLIRIPVSQKGPLRFGDPDFKVGQYRYTNDGLTSVCWPELEPHVRGVVVRTTDAFLACSTSPYNHITIFGADDVASQGRCVQGHLTEFYRPGADCWGRDIEDTDSY